MEKLVYRKSQGSINAAHFQAAASLRLILRFYVRHSAQYQYSTLCFPFFHSRTSRSYGPSVVVVVVVKSSRNQEPPPENLPAVRCVEARAHLEV